MRCWLAPDDGGGRTIDTWIDPIYRWYDQLIVILSEHSMTNEWIMNEIYDARTEEAVENCRKLFPVRLVGYDITPQWQAFDATMRRVTMKEVRECFIHDFSQWKEHDAYQKAFGQLLKDLKAEGW